jgi:NAD(P)-dependent dehydrogenase (short-subunit alcohol dehydrogenase family)
MPRVVISGANRGLGLEFSRQYAAEGWDVVAACRNPQDAAELEALGKRVSIFALDVADDRSIDDFLRALANVAVDVAILNAGVGGGPPRLAAAVSREDWVPVIV